MKTEERMQILKMIESGKITAEEGLKLMETIETDNDQANDLNSAEETKRSKKQLKIIVYENNMAKPKVNIKIPAGIASLVGCCIPNVNVGSSDLNIRQIIDMIQNGEGGELIEVEDEEKNSKVIIRLE